MDLTLPDRRSARRLLATASLLVLGASLVFTGCDTTVNEEGDPVSVAGDSTDASTTINNPPPGPYDVTGNVTGRVVNRGNNEPIANVAVEIDALDEEDNALTDTTNAAGEFAFTDVPAQSSEAFAANGGYSLHFNTEAADGNYQDNVRLETTLQFSNRNGSDGDPANPAASVTLPLAELSGSISATAVVASDAASGRTLPVSGVPVTLELRRILEYNDGGGSALGDRIEVATVTTSEDGSFAFENVPEGLSSGNYEFIWELDGEKVSGSTVSSYTSDKAVPLSSEGNPEVTYGEIDVVDAVESNLPFQVLDGPSNDDPDLSSQDPTLTFAFNRPVAENDFTTEENLARQLDIDFASRKTLDADGDPTVNVSFNADRDTMTISPSENLQDGTNYSLFGINDIFGDNRFVDTAFEQTADEVAGLPDYSGITTFAFSVGANQTQPAPPEIIVDTDDLGNPNYTDGDVSIPHRVVDTSDVELRQGGTAVELYVSSKGERFTLVDEISVSDSEFEFGEADLNPVIDGLGSGEEQFNQGDNNPFQTKDGSYTPVEVFAKVQSLNGVASANSDTVTVADTDSLGLDSGGTQFADTDGDGDDELRVEFDEPVNPSTVALSDFSISDGSNTASTTGSVKRVDNQAGSFNNSVVIIEMSSIDAPGTDELEVTGLEDLAGVPIEVEGASNEDSGL